MSYDFIFPKGTKQRDIQRTGEHLRVLLKLERMSKELTYGLRSFTVGYGRQ